MRQNVTDQSRFLRLCDIAGLPIGHVPRGLAGAFRKIIELEGKITAFATGEPCPSFAPWQAPEATGLGVVIPCDYIITCAENDFNIISDAIDREREKDSFRELHLHLHGVLQSGPLLESLNFPMFLLKKENKFNKRETENDLKSMVISDVNACLQSIFIVWAILGVYINIYTAMCWKYFNNLFHIKIWTDRQTNIDRLLKYYWSLSN
ncbi:hypothetical protein DPMN_166849 [Dreissena polymorpha]|uniref:Uncharacterized protein n=1 Tax=Dreissena polymorpha TaxID=45954 RepID=A0A9D4EZN2_DREPO|nr:hypothetical protein DPMN_166849 [Dreissena polymorpha]